MLIKRAVLKVMIAVHLNAKANITGPMELLQVKSHDASFERTTDVKGPRFWVR
jgi:hypothetical protein